MSVLRLTSCRRQKVPHTKTHSSCPKPGSLGKQKNRSLYVLRYLLLSIYRHGKRKKKKKGEASGGLEVYQKTLLSFTFKRDKRSFPEFQRHPQCHHRSIIQALQCPGRRREVQHNHKRSSTAQTQTQSYWLLGRPFLNGFLRPPHFQG